MLTNKRTLSVFAFLFLLSLQSFAASPINMEKGDVIAQDLPWPGGLFDYHVAIILTFSGGNADDKSNYTVAEQLTSGYNQRTLRAFIDANGEAAYHGGATLYLNVGKRTEIVDMTRNNTEIRKPYVSNALIWMIEWTDGWDGNPVDGILQLGEIKGIRCDGWTELVYVLNGITIQQSESGGNILTDTDWYNRLVIPIIGPTVLTPKTQFNAMFSGSGVEPSITVKNTQGNVVPDGGVAGKDVTVEVEDGGTGSGLCHFQVFQGAHVSGTPLNQYWVMSISSCKNYIENT